MLVVPGGYGAVDFLLGLDNNTTVLIHGLRRHHFDARALGWSDLDVDVGRMGLRMALRRHRHWLVSNLRRHLVGFGGIVDDVGVFTLGFAHPLFLPDNVANDTTDDEAADAVENLVAATSFVGFDVSVLVVVFGFVVVVVGQNGSRETKRHLRQKSQGTEAKYSTHNTYV